MRQNLENVKKERAATHKVIFAKQFRTKKARNFPCVYTLDSPSSAILIMEETKASLALLSYLRVAISFNSCQCQQEPTHLAHIMQGEDDAEERTEAAYLQVR